jgi:hypothetical protein
MSKPGFPKSNPSLDVISLDHGLEAHVTKMRGIVHSHLEESVEPGGLEVTVVAEGVGNAEASHDDE